MILCGLELHPKKTGIVCCKTGGRGQEGERVAFDFLGYTFQPRRARNWQGEHFVNFLPAISAKAAKAIRKTIRGWRMTSRTHQRLEDLARLMNPVVRGWMHYYGRFYRSMCVGVLRYLNQAIALWARRKYKRLRRRNRASMQWLRRIASREPTLFDLWRLGVRP
ncbi:MAG: reverse transcriptase [Hyphomicrobiales bacterium]|nr:reverse transcriptase [Hyphomicrobiales bacterium]